MAETTETKKRSLDLPWATIVAILAATAGFFVYLNPLQTSRPPERAGFHSDVDRPEDVDARLWQDPLRAASEHEDDMQVKYKDSVEERERENAHHLTDYLVAEFQLHPDDFWVLAVMIPGSSYAEYAETRLRTRQAVLEGLGAERYVPVDNEHVGYVKIDEPEWEWHEVILPYEWCHRDLAKGEKNNNGLPDNVCVLWLRDEEFRGDVQGNGPLFQLDRLLRDSAYLGLNTSSIKTRVIGPFSSTTLRKMIEELVKDGKDEGPTLLENVDMWSPTATAEDELLLRGISGLEERLGWSVEEVFGANSKFASFSFKRSTRTDDEMMQKLVDELQKNRGLDLHAHADLSEGKDRVVVISEWDTFFGRALPLSLRRAVDKKATVNQLLDKTDTPQNVITFNYLRGIDGMLPGAAASSVEKSKNEQPKTSVAREATEGLNQSDYLRRLAAELSSLDAQLRQDSGSGIRAVGVLGGDVYDKLLVLQALRRTFPDTIFFTNNLDARLGHPDEWRWTRNLLVASPFGLTLKNAFQKVPPFRDSNQTAVYAAAFLISQGIRAKDFDKNCLGPVRLYEVGRRGLFDLTHDQTLQGLQPDSPDMQRWWNKSRAMFASGIFLLMFLALAWIFRIVLGRSRPTVRPDWYRKAKQHSHPHVLSKLKGTWALLRWDFWRRTRSSRHVFGSSWTMLVVLTAVSVVSVWFINLWDPNMTEPYSWNDGISAWPTETLRFLICLLSAFYILKTCVMLRQNERYLELHFGLSQRHKSASLQRQSKQPWQERVLNWRDLLTVRYWECETDGCVDPQILWGFYANSGRHVVRFLRILPLVICYFVAGYLLLFLLGWPEVPARGPYARGWDWVFARVSAFAVVLLTFFVADATLLNRQLIGYLTRGMTKWPPQAFNNLRARWSQSGRPTTGITGWLQQAFDNLRAQWSRSGQPIEREAQKEAPVSESVKPVPPNALLVDYLDIDFIARRTEVVGGLIYYPFVIISLLIFSRAGIFDYWTWPLPLLVLIGFNVAYAAFSAAYLRRTAERARQQALQRLNDLLIAHVATGKGDSKDAETIRETAKLIRNESRGAFAAVSQHPLLGALLLPSGTAGIWALVQYFPRLFSN